MLYRPRTGAHVFCATDGTFGDAYRGLRGLSELDQVVLMEAWYPNYF